MLISSLDKLDFIDSLYVVTPDPLLVKEKLSRINHKKILSVHIISDSELLTKRELGLCGWSKQQIIKLRSYKLCLSTHVLSIGADTVILKDLKFADFYSPDRLVVNYRKHDTADKHYLFEIERCRNICNLLDLSTVQTKKMLRDYIYDVFLFDRSVQKELEEYLQRKFGDDYFTKVFPQAVNGYEDMVKTGEWTLYSIFLMEILKVDYKVQEASRLVHQIHTKKELDVYDYSDKAVHFVRKDFDKDLIFSNIKKILPYYENTSN